MIPLPRALVYYSCAKGTPPNRPGSAPNGHRQPRSRRRGRAADRRRCVQDGAAIVNIGQWLDASAASTPSAPALLDGTRIVASYEQFAARAASIAAALRDQHGVRPGDRVVLFMPNRTDYLECLYGIWWAGAAAVPVNAKLHAREAAW